MNGENLKMSLKSIELKFLKIDIFSFVVQLDVVLICVSE